jgi:hypothetical protein
VPSHRAIIKYNIRIAPKVKCKGNLRSVRTLATGFLQEAGKELAADLGPSAGQPLALRGRSMRENAPNRARAQ